MRGDLKRSSHTTMAHLGLFVVLLVLESITAKYGKCNVYLSLYIDFQISRTWLRFCIVFTVVTRSSRQFVQRFSASRTMILARFFKRDLTLETISILLALVVKGAMQQILAEFFFVSLIFVARF